MASGFKTWKNSIRHKVRGPVSQTVPAFGIWRGDTSSSSECQRMCCAGQPRALMRGCRPHFSVDMFLVLQSAVNLWIPFTPFPTNMQSSQIFQDHSRYQNHEVERLKNGSRGVLGLAVAALTSIQTMFGFVWQVWCLLQEMWRGSTDNLSAWVYTSARKVSQGSKCWYQELGHVLPLALHSKIQTWAARRGLIHYIVWLEYLLHAILVPNPPSLSNIWTSSYH